MRDNVWCRSGNSDLKDKVIIGVVEEWSPGKKYPVMLRHEANAIDDPGQLFSGKAGNESRPKQNRFIFQNQCHRDRNLEIPGTQGLENLVTRSTIGA